MEGRSLLPTVKEVDLQLSILYRYAPHISSKEEREEIESWIRLVELQRPFARRKVNKSGRKHGQQSPVEKSGIFST
jgi:hypothetical protein